ncbi:hypothetical protein [Denitratisoma sp. DHT3]|uniref:hypothetical protein n=1 Tax=Denitratisoma sp. DHT3 TaxID=1981880 RepID=UPI0016457170|nr:hypothetical protein [Denitratisoma sp. DHT3]
MTMRQALRRHYAGLVTSGAQLVLLVAAAQSESREVWLVCLGLMALISLFAWMSALRRLWAVRDTPTSRVASAAQGYVELIGRGRPLAGSPLIGKLSVLPCLWYRYQVERRDSDNKWHTEDRGESQDAFVLDDGSAVCVIDPFGAEILTRHKDTWRRGDYRYTEWKLLENDPLYAIGQFRTLGGGSAEIDPGEELKAVLTEWKQDSKKLHARFDLDGNGVLDMKEWALARQAARREAQKRVAEVRAMPDTHCMAQPHDGRLFLVSNLPPDQLARRYGFWAWGHLLIFFVALTGAGGLLGWGRGWGQ